MRFCGEQERVCRRWKAAEKERDVRVQSRECYKRAFKKYVYIKRGALASQRDLNGKSNNNKRIDCARFWAFSKWNVCVTLANSWRAPAWCAFAMRNTNVSAYFLVFFIPIQYKNKSLDNKIISDYFHFLFILFLLYFISDSQISFQESKWENEFQCILRNIHNRKKAVEYCSIQIAAGLTFWKSKSFRVRLSA